MIGGDSIPTTYSITRNALDNQLMESDGIWSHDKIVQQTSHFVRHFQDSDQTYPYTKKMIENARLGLYALQITLKDITSEDELLFGQIINRPLQVIDSLEKGVTDAYYKTVLGKSYDEIGRTDPQAIPQFQVQLVGGKPIPVRDVDASQMERLTTISGIIVGTTLPHNKMSQVRIRCYKCGDTQTMPFPVTQEELRLPRNCMAAHNAGIATAAGVEKCPANSYRVDENDTRYWDLQNVKLQELPEHVPPGDMPRPLSVYCGRRLVNLGLPGARVQIVGVLTSGNRRQTSGGDRISGDADVEIRSSYFQVLGIQSENRFGGGVEGYNNTTPEDIMKFKRFVQAGDVHNRIVKSIAPSIFSREDLKQAIACSLFSAPRKRLPDSTYVRGDINVLLLGDPGTAKSQLLKFAQRVAPIAVFTSGKGASAAGLTASVNRDANGNFALEGGAMVLADGGIVCIDEFDKMRSEDRVAIHEAMEQQTISIAKAGITTVLNSRCAVVAAANPSFGSFTSTGNDTAADKDVKDSNEHSFESTILSRFDMIFLVKDTTAHDSELAQHVIGLHMDNSNSSMLVNTGNEGELTTEELKQYIHYCRSNCHPKLSTEAMSLLENHYVFCRQQVKAQKASGGASIPITVRQLDALERIAESLARMELVDEVTASHVKDAIKLFQDSTMESVKSGVNIDSMTMHDPKQIKQIEEEIKSRVAFGSRKDQQILIRELLGLRFPLNSVKFAIQNLIRRGDFIEKGNNNILRNK